MEENAKSSLLFLEALALLPHGQEILRHIKNEQDNFECKSFLEIITKNPLLFVKIQTIRPFRFLVIRYDKSKHCKLLYDGRHLKHLSEAMPLVIWRFDSNGQLMEKNCDSSNLKSLDRLYYKRLPTPQPLWQLLQLTENVPDPNGFEETLDFLTARGLEKDVKIDFILAPGIGHKIYNWHNPVAPKKTVAVFTNRHFLLSFGMPVTMPRRGRKLKPEVEHVFVPEIFSNRQLNRSSAISVSLSGLNLALNLGVISENHFLLLSKELSKFYASIWMEFDDQFNVRYVSLYSNKQMLIQTEIKNETSWKIVFEQVEKQAEILKKKKETLLSPLVKKLETLSQNNNCLYSRCALQLKAFNNNLKIVLFSTDDNAIHGIKIPLANHLKNKYGTKFRGLTLNGDAKNNLVLLKYTGIIIFNLNTFLRADVVPSDLVPELYFKSCVKDLKNQSPALTLCKKRGKIMGPRLLEKWSFVGSFFMDYFQFDIFSTNSISLSKLSYESIWTKYTKMGGTFHHGLEKLKIAYEKTLRAHSNGGFSFSAKDHLKVGDPLYKTHGEPAETLIELDLISSYGYAGSHISVPKGFCTGYVKEGDGHLVCTEPFQRHKSFEFMAVYFTLWCCTKNKVAIKTVYSNFHQNGIFNIGNYPIDLVIVKQDGSILMYQFDGSYAHGCKRGCPPLRSYVGGKCKVELEKKTSERDEHVLNWTHNVNLIQAGLVQYFVKTDCHDLEYNFNSLCNAFNDIPILNDLISGTFNRKIITLNDVLFCPEELTYIMIAEGHMPDPSSPKALMVLQKKNWSREARTPPGQPLLFTRDYADWLRHSFNFQFTKIHQVFFYKKCHILNSIYKDLTLLRMTLNLPSSTKELIKRVINYSAGYFGLNQNGKTVARHKIVASISRRRLNIARHKYEPLDDNFYMKTIYNPASLKTKMSCTGIPIFCCVVEFGKLRMSQILCFFQTCLSPFLYRHLYTNVDNVVIALAAPSLEAALLSDKREIYEKAKINFFQSQTPGHLKEEFNLDASQNWKFVSAAIMNYVVISDKSNVQKISSLNNLTAQESYKNCVSLLNSETIVVDQVRRVNKIANKDVEMITLTFNKETVS